MKEHKYLTSVRHGCDVYRGMKICASENKSIDYECDDEYKKQYDSEVEKNMILLGEINKLKAELANIEYVDDEKEVVVTPIKKIKKVCKIKYECDMMDSDSESEYETDSDSDSDSDEDENDDDEDEFANMALKMAN